MWGVLLFVCIVVSSLPVYSQIVINEVYYDHPGRDEGHEFIEVINVGHAPRSLAGFVLEFHDGRSDGWRVVWTASQSDRIGAGALFVVGGDGVVPRPDGIALLGLQNGPDAVRLVVQGIEVDRVGYGELAGESFFERRPSPGAPEGSSLARYPDGLDTDDNAADFRVRPPSPGRFNLPRDDVGLALAGGTALRRIIDEGAAETVNVRVTNGGVNIVASGAASVALFDSTLNDVRQISVETVGSAVHPGDSVTLDFTFVLPYGYHRMALVSRYDDDNPANDRVTLLRRVGHPSLLVSEVMSLPREGCPEYVELFNAGGAPYRFDNHYLRDRSHTPTPAAAGSHTIPPGGYFVITEDKPALLGCHAALDSTSVAQIAGAWPSLNHSGSGGEADSVIVLDHFLLAVDAVAYPPQSTATRARSLERVDLYPSSGRHVWVLSNDGGSPGRRHDQVVLEPPRGAGVSVNPNPFDPTSGESLVVTLSARQAAARAHVQIFDINGRRLRDIGSAASLPMVLLWDGTDEQGRVVASGIYVIACEFLQLNTGKRFVERVVLGCGRKSP